MILVLFIPPVDALISGASFSIASVHQSMAHPYNNTASSLSRLPALEVAVVAVSSRTLTVRPETSAVSRQALTLSAAKAAMEATKAAAAKVAMTTSAAAAAKAAFKVTADANASAKVAMKAEATTKWQESAAKKRHAAAPFIPALLVPPPPPLPVEVPIAQDLTLLWHKKMEHTFVGVSTSKDMARWKLPAPGAKGEGDIDTTIFRPITV